MLAQSLLPNQPAPAPCPWDPSDARKIGNWHVTSRINAFLENPEPSLCWFCVSTSSISIASVLVLGEQSPRTHRKGRVSPLVPATLRGIRLVKNHTGTPRANGYKTERMGPGAVLLLATSTVRKSKIKLGLEVKINMSVLRPGELLGTNHWVFCRPLARLGKPALPIKAQPSICSASVLGKKKIHWESRLTGQFRCWGGKLPLVYCSS